MYAKLCNIEILSSYIKEVSVGDLLTIQALVTNPLDWHHFYEKISTIKKGDKTEFTVVTLEGDRLVGTGDIIEVDKWSNQGQYGFKVKIFVRRQKSLTDRRIRGPGRTALEKVPPAIEKQPAKVPEITPVAAKITPKDMSDFREMLKSSLTMDISQ